MAEREHMTHRERVASAAGAANIANTTGIALPTRARITQTAEQRAVVGANPDSDVLVVAGAGSGKTFTMTQRIIELITEHGVRPDSILGLTFTNKAAKELQTRVIAAVTRKTREKAPNGAARVEELTSHPEVLTYDAFFQQIVRQYGLLIGVDQSVMPLSDAGRYELASQVVAESMSELFAAFDAADESDALGEQGASGAGASTAGSAGSEEGEGEEAPVSRFDEMVHGILAVSDECLNYMIDEEHLSFASAAARAGEWNDEFIERVESLIAADLQRHPDEVEVLAEGEPVITSLIKGKKREEERKAELSHKLHLRAVYRARRLLATAKQRRVLLRLAEKYDERKRANAFAEFSDFTVYALQLLERFPSIGQEYRRRFTHVFLDEYQDTSTTQSKLIAKLFHPRGRWQRSAVTAVGDPFQSIYAWRGASPGAFTLFRGDFDLETVEPSTLSASVRNPQVVLDAANALTAPLRHPELLSRKGSTTSSQVREVDVATLSVLPRGGEEPAQGSLAVMGYSSRGQEAEAIARFARMYARKYRRDAETPVAVLVRSKTHMAQYRKALEAEGLRYEVVGFSDLMARPEIQDLFSLLEAVTDHTASASVLRLLGSPRFDVPGSQLRLLSDMANDANRDLQYAALRAAGFGTGLEDAPARRALVRAHRDVVPNLTTLVEVVEDGEVEEQMRHYRTPHGFSAEAIATITKFSQLLRRVEAVKNAGVTAALHEAVEALDLDIDLVVAKAMESPEESCITRSQVSARLEVIFQMVDTYSSELPAGISPTLGGFVRWIQTLEKDPIEPAVSTGQRADVVLMTIHQSKGLGFRAVAVAGMQEGVFPSSNSVRVKDDVPEPGESGRTHLHYSAIEKSWIERAASVPAPMRTDARILPRFPHSAIPGNPLDSLYFIKSVDALDAEVYGADEGNAKVGQNFDFLSLREEYGSRAHADERRLAYVAVTRSKDAVLLSFAAHERSTQEKTGTARTDVEPEGAGVFWKDAADFALSRAGSLARGLGDSSEISQLPQGVERQCIGVVTGEEAADIKAVVMDDVVPITDEDLDRESGAGASAQVVWPAALVPQRSDPLNASARLVADEGVGTFDSVSGTRAVGAVSVSDAVSEVSDTAVPGSLLSRAHVVMGPAVMNSAAGLHADTVNAGSVSASDLAGQRRAEWEAGSGDASETPALAQLRERAAAVLPTVSLGVTRLQHFASAQGDQEEQQLLGILRPVPQPPNFAAELGTRFHQWAQEFFDEEAVASPVESGEGEESRRLRTWQQHLETSRWVGRGVEALEQEYVIEVFGLRVVAKIDAIFRGTYDGDVRAQNGRHFTIVDWKTGRKPATPEAVLNATLQLELYRIAFMRNAQVPLDHIDACLYYVDQTDESARVIRADDIGSEEEILAAVRGRSALLEALERGKETDETSL